MSQNNSTIGFIGLGSMGLPMARNYSNNGEQEMAKVVRLPRM